jgi:Porin PorA
MSRRLGLLLLFLGLFLLFFALFERFYAYPRLQKAPLDQYSKAVATGTGSYFDRSTLKEVTNAQLRNIRVVRGDVKAGSSKTAVWDTFSSTADTAKPQGEGVITASQERVALDRVTAESVHCCGDNPPHQGLTLKFPFNTGKRTYTFWDTGARQAFPAAYVGSEKLDGLGVYRFEQRFDGVKTESLTIGGDMAGDPTKASVPASVVYGNVKTLWVEPRTGIVIRAQQDVNQTLQTEDGRTVLTVVDAKLAYDDATVRHNLDEARDGRSQLAMLSTTLPIGGLLLGILLVAGGLLLAARRPGPRVAGTPQSSAAGAA